MLTGACRSSSHPYHHVFLCLTDSSSAPVHGIPSFLSDFDNSLKTGFMYPGPCTGSTSFRDCSTSTSQGVESSFLPERSRPRWTRTVRILASKWSDSRSTGTSTREKPARPEGVRQLQAEEGRAVQPQHVQVCTTWIRFIFMYIDTSVGVDSSLSCRTTKHLSCPSRPALS